MTKQQEIELPKSGFIYKARHPDDDRKEWFELYKVVLGDLRNLASAYNTASPIEITNKAFEEYKDKWFKKDVGSVQQGEKQDD